ncbi:hypothetical protein ACIBCM_06680 [Streptomyces sp. NPDC051018]|uniref:hypothetical protein n=1 Tax=Streptomyces sp. NPDC051018 TaxID=3365639 RepID=UPI00378A4F55
MATVVSGRTFEHRLWSGAGGVVQDLRFDRCVFIVCSLVQFDDPEPPLVARNITATRCTLDNCSVAGVRFEDITIEHLTVRGWPLIRGCVFSRVTLKGRIGPLVAATPLAPAGSELHPYATGAIVDAYASVDWALDISEAEFTDVALDLVPGNLIRRDPETQFLLHRDKLEGLDPQTLPRRAKLFVDRFQYSPFDTMVAVAPKRSRYFRDFLESLEELRKRGLAE